MHLQRFPTTNKTSRSDSDLEISVGQLPTITYSLELPTVEVTGYSHKAVCPLSVGISLTNLAEPMGCLGDTDQFVFTDRVEPDHPIVNLQEKITLEA